MKKSFVILFMLWAIASSSLGYPESYSPFEKGESPPAVKLCECGALNNAPGKPDILYFVPTNITSSLVVKLQPIKRDSDEMWQVTVRDKKGISLSKPVTNDMPTHCIRVSTADLNQDGETDFIVNIWSGGCGLAGEGSTTTFLLSDKGKYKATNFYSYGFGSEDIVRLKPDGPLYFIHNDLIANGNEKTRDGRDHNFWVYTLYKFSGNQMVEANKDDPRFPKWVWYSFKDNHQETDLLNADQKKSIMETK